MVSCMVEGVGLVHQMPFACDRTGIPATLEKVGQHFLRPSVMSKPTFENQIKWQGGLRRDKQSKNK